SETLLHVAAQVPIQFVEYLIRLLGECAHSTQGANDHGNDHGRPQSLAADVADHDQSATAGERDHLEEIAAHLGSRVVDAFNAVAADLRWMFRNHEPLHFAGSGHLAFQRGHFRASPQVALAFADEDNDEARIAQANGKNRGYTVEDKPLVEDLQFVLAHLRERPRIWKQHGHPAHNHELHDEDG